MADAKKMLQIHSKTRVTACLLSFYTSKQVSVFRALGQWLVNTPHRNWPAPCAQYVMSGHSMQQPAGLSDKKHAMSSLILNDSELFHQGHPWKRINTCCCCCCCCCRCSCRPWAVTPQEQTLKICAHKKSCFSRIPLCVSYSCDDYFACLTLLKQCPKRAHYKYLLAYCYNRV